VLGGGGSGGGAGGCPAGLLPIPAVLATSGGDGQAVQPAVQLQGPAGRPCIGGRGIMSGKYRWGRLDCCIQLPLCLPAVSNLLLACSMPWMACLLLVHRPNSPFKCS
jgi:hypothetical protein